MRREFLLLACLVVTSACFAQDCQLDPKPQPDSPFAYLQAEIKSLQWLRTVQVESKKIPAMAPPDDPEREKKAQLRNTLATGLERFYDCAIKNVEPYRESKNPAVHESANGLLTAMQSSKDVNRNVLVELQQLDKVQSKEEIDPEAAKRLDDLAAQENDARTAIQAGVKVSTFAIMKLKDASDPQSEPVAFLINAKQHDDLLAQAKELKQKKTEDPSFIDDCAQILLSALNEKLPLLPN